MEPARRNAVLRSIASAAALEALVREAHQVERILDAAERIAPAELRPELERRRAGIESEVARLVETFEAERRLARVLEEARAEADADVARKARERLGARRWEEAGRSAADRLKAWGCEIKQDERRKP